MSISRARTYFIAMEDASYERARVGLRHTAEGEASLLRCDSAMLAVRHERHTAYDFDSIEEMCDDLCWGNRG